MTLQLFGICVQAILGILKCIFLRFFVTLRLLAFAAGAFIGVASLKRLDSGFVMRRGMSNNGPLKSDIASAQNDILHELDYKASDIFRPMQLCSPSDAKLSNCYNTRTSKKV